jgi:hypothetical protein
MADIVLSDSSVCQISFRGGNVQSFFRSKTQTTVMRNIFFAGSWMHPPDFWNEIRNNPPNSKPNSNQFLRLFYTTLADINTCCYYTHDDRPFIIEPTATLRCVSCVQTCQRHLLTHPHLWVFYYGDVGAGQLVLFTYATTCAQSICPRVVQHTNFPVSLHYM